MAVERVIEIVAKTEKATAEIKDLFNNMVKGQNEAQENQKELNKSVEKIADSAKNAETGVKKIGKAFRGVGLALKAIGIGLLLEGFSLLKDILSENQRVADFFKTALRAVTIVVTDLFNFVIDNASVVTDVFKDPQQAVNDLGQLIKENIIERFNSAIEVAGLLQKALKELFTGEFKSAFNSVKDAAKEGVDVLTGVNNSVDRAAEATTKLVEKTSDYLKGVVKVAAETVKLENAAVLAAAAQAKLIAQLEGSLEAQRKIRDDESISIEQRKQANDELLKISERLRKELKTQADLQVSAALAARNANKDNIELEVAYQESLTNRIDVLNQIQAQQKEQNENRVALLREEIELNQTLTDGERERQLAKLEFDEGIEENELLRLEKQRERLNLENELILADIEAKRELFALGTQARVDAENDYLNEKLRIDNEITQNEIDANKSKEASAEALENAKKELATNGLIALGNLAKQGSALAKGVAVSQAVISTYQGINKALAETTDFTPTQSLRTANAIAVGVAGFANVAKILSTNDSGATSAPQSPTGISAPSFNVVEGTSSNQIAQSIQTQDQPIKAFVVSGDVTTSQELDRNIIDNSSL